MIRGITCLSLLVMTFETILYKTLYKLIGLNLLTRVGLLIIGIRAIKIELREDFLPISLRKARTTSLTATPTIDQ